MKSTRLVNAKFSYLGDSISLLPCLTAAGFSRTITVPFFLRTSFTSYSLEILLLYVSAIVSCFLLLHLCLSRLPNLTVRFLRTHVFHPHSQCVKHSLICCLLHTPNWETWAPTQACALTGKQTNDCLVCRPVLNPPSHTSHGQCVKHSN